MNAKLTPFAALLGAALALTGCATPLTKQDVGTVTGAVVGGVAGSVLTSGTALGTVGGAAVGGYIGNRVGKDLDRR